MILLPIGVLWAGYTAAWYGFTMLKGLNVGIVDLIVPGRASLFPNSSVGAGSSQGEQQFTTVNGETRASIVQGR